MRKERVRENEREQDVTRENKKEQEILIENKRKQGRTRGNKID